MEDKPSYYATIPASVRYDKKLNPNAKLIYGEITALSNLTGTCWSSDEYFSNLYGVGKRTIQNWLKDLEDNGYIKRESVYNPKTKLTKRFLTITQEVASGVRNNIRKGYEESCDYNSTSINTTSTNINTLCDFDTFWSLYPRKIAKQKAMTLFKSKVTTQETYDLIIKDLNKRKGLEQWNKDDGKFIPHPSTYLNGTYWLDEYEVKGNINAKNKQNRVLAPKD